MDGGRRLRAAVGMVGLFASAVFVLLALHRLDFRTLGETLHRARPMPWLLFAVLAYLAGHFVRGQRLRVLLSESTLPLPTATNIVVVGYASNNVFPARLGELVRAGVLAERTGIPLSQALTITFIERLLDGIAILVLLLAGGSAAAANAGWISNVARLASLVFGAALTVVLVAVLFPRAILATASRLSARLGPRWRDRVFALATSITSAGASLRRPRDALIVGALSLVVWLFESLMFAFVLPVFGIHLSFAPAMVAMSVTNLGILVPSSPGFVGSFHFFCSQALVSLGLPAATAMGYAIVVHLTFFVPVTLWGAGAILWYGIQVGATAAMARAARASPHAENVAGVPVHVIARLPPARPPGRASAFDVALTEALVAPRGGGAIDPAALADVATFLAQEMDALPARLRLLYRAGMSVFRFYVRARYLRSFCALGIDRRRAAVHTWAFGGVGLLRQLFRPARSTVLLAYYERDDVAQALAPLSVPSSSVLAFRAHG